jgi:ATP phosphoribosyltransferase
LKRYEYRLSRIKLALPKGSLEQATFKILERAFLKIYGQERTYRPIASDPEVEVKILRPQEIPIFVAEGLQDLGITGQDWIKEAQVDVEILLDLGYGKVKLVAAAPKTVTFNTLDEMMAHMWLENKKVRISTEYLNITSQYIASKPIYKTRFGVEPPLVVTPWWRKGSNRMVTIYLSFGATEAKPPEDADIIIDITETGTTLEQNNLKILEVIMESTAVLITNRSSLQDPLRRQKIYDILALLKGVVESEKKLHIFVNVRKENLEKLLGELPALKKPTISQLSDENWYSVNTIVDRAEFLRLLPILRKLAQGLVVHEPQQILPLEEIAREEKGEK